VTYVLPSAPEWKSPVTANKETIELSLSLITPMFGGGYEAREVDEENPIRSAAIRGHLRFWWRATAGGAFATSEELFKAEEELWGSDQKAGLVGILVSDVVHDKPEPSGRFIMRQNGKYGSIPDFGKKPNYALFPFQGKAKDARIEEYPAKVISKATFTLRICAPKISINEVTSAAAAWVKYGGIGARTRRGCGSLTMKQELPPIVLGEIRNPNIHIPFLKGSKMVVGRGSNKDPIEAWKQAVDIYRDFRQKEGYARNKGSEPNRPGRSLWPEPDSIRRITGKHHKLHEPTHPIELGFPRADLGLPIIFQFKDKDYGDPEDATLSGPASQISRFASPVITKAIPVNDGYAPMIIILNSPHAWVLGDLNLTSGRVSKRIPRKIIELTPPERKLIKPINGDKPVREALLDYVSRTWGVKAEEIK